MSETERIFHPQQSRIYVAGHRGMVGQSLLRTLAARWPEAQVVTESRESLDLRDREAVRAFLRREQPDAILVAAARVGGILANSTLPAEFIFDNLAIAQNVVEGAKEAGVRRLLFLGSSCIYPKFAEQPIREDALLCGALEPTNEPYAIAKIAGLKLCQAYRRQYGLCYHSVMPTNLYGPGDNYHPEHSHVIAAMIRRFHQAKMSGLKEVTIWGTGTPLREILHVDDLAEACLRLLEVQDPPDWVNVGSGEEVSILELAKQVAETIGFEGVIRTDPEKPDGTPRKMLDSSLMKSLGWKASIDLRSGLETTYQKYLEDLDFACLRS